MIKKYRKKPITIQAIQLTLENHDEAMNWTNKLYFNEDDGHITNYLVDTLEGQMTANVGDYLIKGIKGEFYSCKKDIFEESYEEV